MHPIPSPNFTEAVFSEADLHIFYVPVLMDLTYDLVADAAKGDPLATAFKIVYFYSRANWRR